MTSTVTRPDSTLASEPALSADEIITTLVLPNYPQIATGARVARFGTGLINQTYLVEHDGGRHVLQRMSPIFTTDIHANIAAVARHLDEAGLRTPQILTSRARGLFLDLGVHGIWRLLTHVDGVSFDVIVGAEQARAAGDLVGRFHCALENLQHRFTGMRAGVHDTPRHLQALRDAIARHPQHRLEADVAALAGPLLAAAERLTPLPALPDRIGHGDLKFNNILFAAAEGPGALQPVCLIDLDTVGPLPLAFELGDAWRSWCNRNGENLPEAALDLEIFSASLQGYRQGLARSLTTDERLALLLGLEWVSLELSARFAADALNESYFGWNPQQFAGRGEHNLVRAQGQWSLHRALMATRADRARLLDLDLPG